MLVIVTVIVIDVLGVTRLSELPLRRHLTQRARKQSMCQPYGNLKAHAPNACEFSRHLRYAETQPAFPYASMGTPIIISMISSITITSVSITSIIGVSRSRLSCITEFMSWRAA